uniref:OTU deubiquitinase 5 n=1 Tax=Macaca nemestrina TaxID=9545 RepID=A0A2K6DSQ5_MACNE
MTILPKKKPPPPDADPANEPPPPGPLPPAPRPSPPPQGPLPGPPGALHRWALAVPPGAVAGPRPQQASPPPCGGPGGPGGGPGDALGAAAAGVGAAGVVVGVGGAVGVGGCCSGPGHSKRRRQAPGVGAVGGGSPEREEVGAGYNSEDEYEAAAARIEAMDPATVEQQEHWFEKALRDKKGFIIKQMKEDGACLFRAVAAVYGDQDMQVEDFFSTQTLPSNLFCRLTTTLNRPRKRKNQLPGKHIEMQAMQRMYQTVYQYSTGTFCSGTINHSMDTINEDTHTCTLCAWPFAEQSLMKNAIKTSEESWIEQQMLEDKKRATDWEATNEAIEEQVARESYLQWLRDQEKQARQVRGPSQPRKASATCSSATAAASSGLEEWTSRSPRQRSSASSPEHPELHAELGIKPPSPGTVLALAKPPSPCAPGTSSQFSAGADRATSPLVSLYPALECRALIQQMSPSAFGLNDWDDDEILASVLAVSQQEYLDSMKKNKVHRDPPPDKS